MDTDDEVILLRDLAKKISPRSSYATVWRWATRGVKRNGVVVKLAVVHLPSGMASTIGKYREFLAALSKEEAR